MKFTLPMQRLIEKEKKAFVCMDPVKQGVLDHVDSVSV
jgi:hypothetical protein